MGHEIQDQVSIEMARRIAVGLPEHPEWIELARENLQRWSQQNQQAPRLLRCYAEWTELLSLPVREIARILTEQTEEGQRLRQNSPFVGVLSTRASLGNQIAISRPWPRMREFVVLRGKVNLLPRSINSDCTPERAGQHSAYDHPVRIARFDC